MMVRRGNATVVSGEVTGFSAVKTKKFVYLGGSVIRQLDYNDNVEMEYIRGLDLGGGIGGIIYQKKSSDYYYYHYNHKGDVVALTDANGNLAAYYEYDAWGNTMTQAEASGVENPYKYSTKEWDEKSGLYYFGARYYSPEIGRWTQRDPAGIVDGLNIYLYANNEPVSEWDPWGLRVSPKKPKKDPSDYWECIMAFKGKAVVEQKLARIVPELKKWWEDFNVCCLEVKYGTRGGAYCKIDWKDTAGSGQYYGDWDIRDDIPFCATNEVLVEIPEMCKVECAHEYAGWVGRYGQYRLYKKKSSKAFLKLLKKCLPLLKK